MSAQRPTPAQRKALALVADGVVLLAFDRWWTPTERAKVRQDVFDNVHAAGWIKTRFSSEHADQAVLTESGREALDAARERAGR